MAVQVEMQAKYSYYQKSSQGASVYTYNIWPLRCHAEYHRAGLAVGLFLPILCAGGCMGGSANCLCGGGCVICARECSFVAQNINGHITVFRNLCAFLLLFGYCC